MSKLALLPARGVVEVSGDDRVGFLQGLVSNDVGAVAPGEAVWTALLTPQGKWLADFFVIADGDRLLLDVERAQAGMIAARLAKFRLRAKVALRDASGEFAVYAAWDGLPELPEGVPEGVIVGRDPRLAEAGWRVLVAGSLGGGPLAVNATAGEWEAHRIGLGLPDGSADMEAEKSVLLEAGFDELHGVSWSKGCYMGQELTARTKYRGLVKRRLVPVTISGPVPAPGTAVVRGGVEVGTLRSAVPGHGLATLRLDALRGEELSCGAAVLVPVIPGWMRLPEAAE